MSTLPRSGRTRKDWIAWAEADPRMKAVSRDEWAGPCPACMGTDRFRVNKAGAFCRTCCPDGKDVEAYKAICRAAGFDVDGERSGWTPPPRPAPAPAPAREPRSQQNARTILARAAGPVGTPAERYLINRNVWPSGTRAPPVKWIGARAFPAPLPTGAAGAIVFQLVGKEGPAPACQWQPLAADGTALLHKGGKRITYGASAGRVFVGNRPPFDPPPVTIICEGPIDALAAYWLQKHSRALILGSAGDLANFPLWCVPPNVPVTIEAHGDATGKRAIKLLRRLMTAGWEARANHRTTGDVADELEAAVKRGGWEQLFRKDST